MTIYTKLAEIQRGIHGVGIAKNRRNQDQKFNFRGIDDAIAALAPLLSEFGVIVFPAYSGIVIDPRATKSGGTTYNVQLQGTFTFVDSEDGSERMVGPFYGEANDGQDKAISKATSVAYRNMVFLTFCAPHEAVIGGDPDEKGESDAPSYLDDEFDGWRDIIDKCQTPENFAVVWKDMSPAIRAVMAPYVKKVKEAKVREAEPNA